MIGIDVKQIKRGITLQRFYTTRPDQCGTVEFWDNGANEIFSKLDDDLMPRGLTLNIMHLDHPSFEVELKNKRQCLKDGNPDQLGFQVCEGLCWPGAKRIDLSLTPKGFRAEVPTIDQSITQEELDNTLQSLNHEIGHYWHDYCVGDCSSLIKAEVIREYRRIVNDPVNEDEMLAERYRATLGANSVIGTYSDGKRPQIKPELSQLFRIAPMLVRSFSVFPVSNLTVYNDRVEIKVQTSFWKTDFRIYGSGNKPIIAIKDWFGNWKNV